MNATLSDNSSPAFDKLRMRLAFLSAPFSPAITAVPGHAPLRAPASAPMHPRRPAQTMPIKCLDRAYTMPMTCEGAGEIVPRSAICGRADLCGFARASAYKCLEMPISRARNGPGRKARAIAAYKSTQMHTNDHRHTGWNGAVHGTAVGRRIAPKPHPNSTRQSAQQSALRSGRTHPSVRAVSEHPLRPL